MMGVLNDRGDNAPYQLDPGVFTNLNPDGKDATTVYGGAIPPVPPGAPPANPGAATVPGRPTIAGVVATGVTGQIRVAFYAPGNGGSPITQYQVRNDEQQVVATGTSSPILVNGLKSKKSTTVSVVAVNAIGTGERSAESGLVTPA